MNKLSKRLITTLCAITLFFFVFIAFLPTLISTQLLNPLLFSLSSRVFTGSLSADTIQVSWLNGIELKGLTLSDNKGEKVLEASKVAYKHSLFTLFSSDFPKGALEIDAPFIAVTNDSGKLVLDEVLRSNDSVTNLPKLNVADLHLSLDLSSAKTADISLSCLIHSSSAKSGKIDLQANIQNVFELESALKSALQHHTDVQADVHVTIDSLSTDLVQAALQSVYPDVTGFAKAAIGPEISADIICSLKDDVLVAKATVESEKLKGSFKGKIQNSSITISDAANFRYTVVPDLVKTLSGFTTKSILQNLTLSRPVTVQIQVPQGSFSLSGDNKITCEITQDRPFEFKSQMWKTPLTASVKGNAVLHSRDNSLVATSELSLNFLEQDIHADASLHIQQPFTPENSKVVAEVTLDAHPRALAALFSQDVRAVDHLIGQKMRLTAKAEGTHTSANGSWSLSSETLSNEGTFRYKDDQFQIAPFSLKLALSHDRVRELWPNSYELTAPVTVQANLDFALQGSSKANLHISNLDFSYNEKRLATFDIKAPFTFDSENSSIAGSIEVTSESNASIKAIYDASFKAPFVANLNAQFSRLPVDILSHFNKDVPALIGNTLSGKLEAGYDSSLKKNKPFSLSLKGDDLDVSINVPISTDISAKRPLAVSWKVTADRFLALQRLLQKNHEKKLKELALQKPFDLQFSVTKIALPLQAVLDGTTSLFDGLSIKFEGSTTLIDCLLSEKKEQGTTHAFAIAPLDFQAELKAASKAVTFEVESHGKTGAQVTMSGKAENLWNEKGFDTDKVTVKLDVKVQDLPLDILQGIAGRESTADQVVDVLGKTINLDMKGQVTELKEGSFEGKVSSSRLTSNVSCLLKEGNLYLNRPIVAEYELTPEAGKVLLKDLNPLLVTAARSKAPITLWVDSEGFSIPLNPFSLKDIKIKTIKVDPGVILAKNGGFLSLLAGFLQVKASIDEDLPLWFTPIHIKVKHGVVDCLRTDVLLANEFPIATWGSIDLIENKVDMILGLSGQALSKAFQLRDIDPEYLVQIPIKGTTQSPKFDTVRATAKITALKLQQHKNATGLIGGLLEIAASAGDKEKAPPKPTTYPFPWKNRR